ncbi:hypothetical protein HPP92_017830 [Vanilla planifolia]|uniref:DUF3700 domain-containing protein n=1 Tax=Vanilla planifolia TaxID=51239 RepID=A0A835UNT2_VANPL|nr:hypothetical protein HPP92_017830 [Vanilla planifolia]
MLGVFSREVAEAPEELVAAGSHTPSPKKKASELVNGFIAVRSPVDVVSLQLGSFCHLAYSYAGASPFRPRLFAAKDEIYCMFVGILDNLGSLIQHYGLSKNSNEVLLLIEAYKALRDRAPYRPSFMFGNLSGNFAFVLFDRATSTVLVASDADGKVPLFWGITADGCLAFADDVEILKGSCGKSLAQFPQGCFYSNAFGGLKSYEHPKRKVTATLAAEEEICGATFRIIWYPFDVVYSELTIMASSSPSMSTRFAAFYFFLCVHLLQSPAYSNVIVLGLPQARPQRRRSHCPMAHGTTPGACSARSRVNYEELHLGYGRGIPYFYLTELDPTARDGLKDGRSSFTIDPEDPLVKLTLSERIFDQVKYNKNFKLDTSS